MSDASITQTIADFGYAGTVSHGTLRSWDLLNSFLSPLEELSGNEPLQREVRAMLVFGEDEVQYGNKGEEASELLNEVFDELEAVAPDGYYFGNTDGDSSDFGFWVDEYEDEC